MNIETLQALSLDSIRTYLSAMSSKELTDLLRSPAMDYKNINVTAKAEVLARLLIGKKQPPSFGALTAEELKKWDGLI